MRFTEKSTLSIIPTCIRKCNNAARRKRRRRTLTYVEELSPGSLTLSTKPTQLIERMRVGIGGFTLLEVIVVVFILSLLAAIVAPRIMGRTDDARIAEAKVQIRNFETALKLFKLDNGFYPTTDQGLEALVAKPKSGNMPARYRDEGYLEQKKIPMDPWGKPYVYVSPGVNGDYDIISYGADGEPGGEGKNKDIESWNIEK